MHTLSHHLHHSSCLVTHPKPKSSGMQNGKLGNSKSKKSKPKPRNALAYFKQANQKGSNFKWRKPRVSTWVVDSGCSRHMTGTLELLSSYIQQEDSSVAFRGNQKGKIKGYGIIVKGEVNMNQVSYVDRLQHNLIRVSQLCDNGMDVMFKIKYCIMYKADSLIEGMRANRRGDLYLICFEALKAK
ncbi:hypothetical protein OSB04_031761 [Centaurea solstitialis]|uniref:Retrovirus-related Pol polyprotein from transposon TNT 1-94-like beta-barrel domain-containing protein n=1 Tax=Centaurea solstitialis TaxID=347529 RepID=A0AA38SHM9_9ASTR|nr:hypothetical protein OSB04_031761 [Centaurea solstitialis]